MGRKPNQLILEFFHRGQKIEDQSNRYEHTCKHCGMLFAKGRPDSMNRHIFDKCPNISDLDKQRAYAYAQGRLDPKAIAKRFGDETGPQQFTGMPPVAPMYNHDSLQTPEGPSLNRETSALDTLAEVSRQHFDLTRQRNQQETQPSQQDLVGDTQDLNEEEWMLHLQQQLEDVNAQEEHTRQEQDTAQSYASVAPLVQAASAAADLNEALGETPQTYATTHNLDPSLALPPYNPHRVANMSQTTQPPVMLDQDTMPHANLFSLSTQPKAKRGRFSADRRREVGGMRKVGACIRCRMLKKPCSEGTPCATCASVNTPRLWRAACVRTRVADEFTLYNTSYFFARAREQAMLSPLPPVTKLAYQIETVTADGILSLPALGHLSGHAPADPAPLSDLSSVDLLDVSLEMDLAYSELQKVVTMFLASQQQALVENETNHFLKTTIGKLQATTVSESDELVDRVILLWCATIVLVNPDSREWTFRLSHDPEHQPQEYFEIPSMHASRSVLAAQVLDAVERFAGITIKYVCNELERRLLARSKMSTNTFLVALILLSSAERMSLLFRTFDHRPTTGSQDSHDMDPRISEDEASVAMLSALPAPDTGAPNSWPLTRPPQAYFAQGRNFTNLLHLLLHLRSLPPRTMMSADGTLAVARKRGRQLVEIVLGDDEGASGMSYLAEDEDENKTRELARWLHDCRAEGRYFAERALMTNDDGTDFVDEHGARIWDWRAWDLRYVAGMLLPMDNVERALF